MLTDTAGITRNLGKAAAPLGRAFLDVAQVGTSMFKEMTKGAGDAATGFSNWIRNAKDTGQLQQRMQNRVNTLKEWGRMLMDVG